MAKAKRPAKDELQAIAERMRVSLIMLAEVVPEDGEHRAAYIEILNFVAVSIRLMGRVNPSKLRDMTYATEIDAHMRILDWEKAQKEKQESLVIQTD